MVNGAYNLLDNPWLPVVMHDEMETTVSLYDLTERISDIKGVNRRFPIHYIALTRLLLAITRAATGGPETTQEWADFIRAAQQGRFPTDTVRTYLEQRHHKFFLLEGPHPFMQWEQQLTADQLLGARWAHYLPIYNRSHTGEWWAKGVSPWTLTPAEAAIELVTHHQFCPGGMLGGGGSGKQGPLIGRRWAGIDAGKLAETLAWNSFPNPQPEPGAVPWDDHAPRLTGDQIRVSPTNVNHAYTWMSRSIRLIPGNDGQVSGVLIRHGYVQNPANKLDERSPDLVFSKHTGKPLNVARSRAVWRDTDSLLQRTAMTESETAAPPSLFERIVNLTDDYAHPDLLDQGKLELVTGGLISTNKAVFGQVLESYPLTQAILEDGTSRSEALLSTATATQNAAKDAVWQACRSTPSGTSQKPGAVKTAFSEPHYWTTIGARFSQLLQAANDPTAEWAALCETTGWECAKSAIQQVVTSTDLRQALAVGAAAYQSKTNTSTELL